WSSDVCSSDLRPKEMKHQAQCDRAQVDERRTEQPKVRDVQPGRSETAVISRIVYHAVSPTAFHLRPVPNPHRMELVSKLRLGLRKRSYTHTLRTRHWRSLRIFFLFFSSILVR